MTTQTKKAQPKSQAKTTNSDLGKPRFRKAYGFALVTGVLFLGSWIGQFITQYMVVADEAQQHGEDFEWGQFFPQFFASTFENWQSEFLQLIWQAAGLSFLYFWASSQSKESDERMEAKIDMLLARQNIDPDEVTKSLNSQM